MRYRLTRNSKLLYRNPAYIISTDPDLNDADILQWYLWRWEIELDFRDEKSIVGINEAMIRTPEAVESWVPFAVCSYSLLLLAGHAVIAKSQVQEALPKWQKNIPFSRPSTNHYRAILRQQVMEASGENNFNGFRDQHPQTQNTILFIPDMKKAVAYAKA